PRPSPPHRRRPSPSPRNPPRPGQPRAGLPCRHPPRVSWRNRRDRPAERGRVFRPSGGFAEIGNGPRSMGALCLVRPTSGTAARRSPAEPPGPGARFALRLGWVRPAGHGGARPARPAMRPSPGAGRTARLAGGYRTRAGDPGSSMIANYTCHDRQRVNEDLMSGYDRVVQPAAGDDALENHLGGDEAKNYRRYEFDMVAPHVGRSMLEIGSGLGHFAEQFLPRVDRLVVSDFDPYCVERLRERFAGHGNVSVLQFALPAEVPLDEPVESVVMMNVLEHIAEDVDALRSVAKVTVPGGRI